MGLLRSISRLGQRWLGNSGIDDPHSSVRRLRICRFEKIESRRMMAADLHVGSVYLEGASGDDTVPNLLQFTFEGGVPGTQLKRIVIDGDKDGKGRSSGDVFFDTAPGGLGAFKSNPLQIVSHDGFTVTKTQVVDGGMTLIIDLEGFDVGEKLVLSIDVDESQFVDPETGEIDANSLVEGGEFQRSHFIASFTAPHYEDITAKTQYWDAFDKNFETAEKETGSHLNLPPDRYQLADPELIDMTAGAVAKATQIPLPNSLSGVVYVDANLNNHQDAGDAGIGGVLLTLYRLEGNQYVTTGKATTTDAQGRYRFDGLGIDTYRVIETQPTGYFSVGATPGTVNGETRGVVTTVDILSGAFLLGGDDSIRNDFAESLPNSIAGHVGVDVTGDCIANPDTPPIAGVVIKLLDSTGNVIRTTTTDALGNYIFDNLPAGVFTVVEEQPEGYLQGDNHAGTAGGVTQGFDIIATIPLTSDIHGIHYDFCELLPVSIAGHVGIDYVGGLPASSRMPPIPGVTIELLDAGGTVIATTLTDSQGNYSFDALPPGTYGVHEVQPVGYFNGDTEKGSHGGLEGNDVITIVKLLSDHHAVEYNFSEIPPASISGFVGVDCEPNMEPPPIAGVTIELLDSTGKVIRTTTTDALGNYSFHNLMPGTYGVHEVQPEGYYQGETRLGSKGGVISALDTMTQVVLGPAVDGVHYDFCELLPVSISGHVFVTTTGDCKTDPNPLPLSGVVIHLLNANGQVIDTKLTDVNGRYSFDALPPGTYGVSEEQPVGYFNGMTDVGSEGGVAGNDIITTVVLNSGVAAIDYDFCEIPPASLCGFVYVDINNNGHKDPGEAGIGGATLKLLDANGVPTGATTVTAADGSYCFMDLPPGTYGVAEVQPPGYFDGLDEVGTAGGTAHNPGDLLTGAVLTGGLHAEDYNFGELPPASLCGFVYVDINNNGLKDAGEAGIAGATLRLLDANGNPTGVTTTTAADGSYCFMNLAPGTYGVAEVQPVGYFDGLDSVGTAGGIAHNPGDLLTGAVLPAGLDAKDYNFGELPPASISGNVHVRHGESCEIEDGAMPLGGVTIQLLDSRGVVIATTTTNDNGFYEFTALAPGAYSVAEIQPLGYFEGDADIGSVGGTAPTSNLLAGILLNPGTQAIEYNFCEIPPGEISGFVFQDGPPIAVENPGDIPDVKALRDGKLTPDDTRLPGVTLMLRDGVTGQPIFGSTALAGTYDPTLPITTVTDANGFYIFSGLPPGVYGVYDVQPGGYIPGIDTAGSLGGVVISIYEVVDPAVLAGLTSPPQDDAIVAIGLPAGFDSVMNNFSVVTTATSPIFPFLPPLDPPPLIPPQFFVPPVELPVLPILQFPFLVLPIITRAGGQLYTWHLSIVDAGQPRGDKEEQQQLVQLTAMRPGDESAWRDHDLTEGAFTLGGDPRGGKKVRRQVFGLRGAIPVSGDFNGDGKFEVGIFKDGEWFIDLNDNGMWDEGDLWAKLGHKGDRPVTGDWDGDGKTDIGIYGPAWRGDPKALAYEPGIPDPNNENTAVHKNIPRPAEKLPPRQRQMQLTAKGKPRADLIDHVFLYGTPGDHPLVGDWNGDGTATIAVFRDGVWHRDIDGDGKWSKTDEKANFGQSGDKPVVGDFNGDGTDELGVYRDGTWYIDSNGNGQIDAEDMVIELGGPGDQPVVGDWDGDGTSDPGVYHDPTAPVSQTAGR